MLFNRSVGLIAFVAALILAETGVAQPPEGTPPLKPEPHQPPAARTGQPAVAKTVLGPGQAQENLLRSDAWKPYEKGFERQAAWFVCDNGTDAKARRGIVQNVQLNQTRPEPIIATCSSKCENVSGTADHDYSLYLDLVYTDGTPLWGQAASFSAGTHDWQRRQVVILPEKPVKQVSFYMLLRGHGGKAWFRDPELSVIHPPAGACLFDGLPVVPAGPAKEGFQIRDVAAGSDFVRVEGKDAGHAIAGVLTGKALDVDLLWDSGPIRLPDGKIIEDESVLNVDLSSLVNEDRAITLMYTIPVAPDGLRWLDDPRRPTAVEPGREYMNATTFRVGSNGRLSRYPLAAVGNAERGVALAIPPSCPAFCRLGYNTVTGELFVAFDLGLARERPITSHITQRAHSVQVCRFTFDPALGFRGALAKYYKLFPEAFRRRVPEQGLWMPFAKISAVQGWEDFGFKFKEGNDETKWDDQHNILTFRYTEPMTWWMSMPKEMPRTLDAALAQARRLADKGNAEAKALFTSGYHDADGRFVARLLDTPWTNGAVWSMNSMPGIAGDVTDFKNKWNLDIQGRLYGPFGTGLDGEYVDSSEGYVTDELDFRRDHFAAAQTPLVFSPEEHRPAIFRGLVAFEYVRGIETDVHGRGKLMMANGAPDRLWWLAPMLDVLGTETDWNPGGKWRPMSDADLLYRRAMCKGKPYCVLMNTRFEDFSPALVEKYMKRCLAYGMFPGFFSHNASQGQYFTRPELYNRDRPLFKKYVPLCKLVAEAGWEPITQARSDDDRVYVERFGSRYFTVFNDSHERRTATITLENRTPTAGRELLSGRAIQWRDGQTTLALEGEDVAVIEIR